MKLDDLAEFADLLKKVDNLSVKIDKVSETVTNGFEATNKRLESLERGQETTNKILLDVAKVVSTLVDRTERTELAQLETNKLLRELIGEVREVKDRYNSLEARIEKIEKVVFKAS